MPAIRVAAISNSPSFLADVQHSFATHASFDFVGSCTRKGLRRLVAARRPDVLLVDGRIERPLNVCSRVRRDCPPWIVMLADEARELVEFRDLWKMAALAAGARGVLGRGSIASELVDAVREVQGGRFWGPPALVDRVIERGV